MYILIIIIIVVMALLECTMECSATSGKCAWDLGFIEREQIIFESKRSGKEYLPRMPNFEIDVTPFIAHYKYLFSSIKQMVFSCMATIIKNDIYDAFIER